MFWPILPGVIAAAQATRTGLALVKDAPGAIPSTYGAHRVYIDGVRMPVAPAAIETKIDNRNEKVRLADGRTMKILNEPGLVSYSMELLLPFQEYSWAEYEDGFKPQQYYIDLFDRLKADKDINKRVFRLLIVRQQGPVLTGGQTMAQMCTLEDYRIVEDADKDVLDRRVVLTFERYDDHKTEVVQLKKNEDGSITATVSKAKEKEPEEKKADAAQKAVALEPYTVQPGDTLGGIAKRFLGDFERYRELAKINNIADANHILPGQVIKFA